MADEQVQVELQQDQGQLTDAQKLQAAVWEDNFQQPAQTHQQELPKEPTPAPDDDEEEIIEPNEWVKREYGWENAELGKKELEELREYKTKVKPAEEIKFANEESEKLHKAILAGNKKEVYKILERQERLERLSSLELNPSNASAIVRANMQIKGDELGLTEDEINYEFNKKYSIPAKPVKLDTDLDGEYEQRLSEWEQAKRNVEMELMIAAKYARPELDKIKSELVIPDIAPKQVQPEAKQPTQEELDAEAAFKSEFVKKAKQSIDSFSGFSTTVKDKDVEIPINYVQSSEEKEFISKQISAFAESGFNANAILADRWVNSDRTLNTDQMVKDLSLIYNEGKISNKFATDAANKRLELYLKEKKNINISDSNKNGTFNPDGDKTEHQKLQEHFWNN